MDFDKISDELKAKALKCKTPEEVLELARSEGYDLTDEQLQSIAGGSIDWDCLYHDCTNYKPW